MKADLELKKIDELEEIDLWREIDEVNSLLRVAACNKIAYGLEGDKYTKLALYYQQLVYQTMKFGVEFDSEEYGDNFRESLSFKAWKNYWLRTLLGLGRERYMAFQGKKIDAKDLEGLLPKANWKEEYESQKEKVKK